MNQGRIYNRATGEELTNIDNMYWSTLADVPITVFLSGKAGWKRAEAMAGVQTARRDAGAHVQDPPPVIKLTKRQQQQQELRSENIAKTKEPLGRGKREGTAHTPFDWTIAILEPQNMPPVELLEAARVGQGIRGLGGRVKKSQQGAPVLFWKDSDNNGYLSNWKRSPFLIDGVLYTHVEQWIMVGKARCSSINSEAEQLIMATTDPAEMKWLGRNKVDLNKRAWKQQRWDNLLLGVDAKFRQNAHLAEKLLRTGSKRIAEASPSDRIYGIGIAPSDPRAQDASNWKGENMLGKALEQVRGTLRNEILTSDFGNLVTA